MKILVVASYNKHRYAPFILEQAEALRRAGCDVKFFGVEGKGFSGYLKALSSLKRKIKSFDPDAIHAHYGLCGLLAGLQRRVPVVTTYHGSDINLRSVRLFSRVSMLLSSHNVFVSRKTIALAKPRKHFSLIPCGIDITDLQLTSKEEARKLMNLNLEGKYVLFAGAFDNAVKNYPLAKTVMGLVTGGDLLELKGYTRDQVTLLMCAADAFLMTSISEGSPQVIKEAMACGCPIVSVDVGDVCEVVESVGGCTVCERNAKVLADNLLSAMSFGRTCGRERIIELGLDNGSVSNKLLELYNTLI